MKLVLVEVVRNSNIAVENSLEVQMLNEQEYRQQLQIMSANLQDLRVSL